jgi:uncharacterized alkaline shock family protein YloU
MTTPAGEKKTDKPSTNTKKETAPSTGARRRAGGSEHELVTELGRTTIADTVVAKIAGIAAREVPGVHALGGGAGRAMGAIRGAVGRPSLEQGVDVEVGEKQAAVDLDIIVDYGVPILDVAEEIRDSVIGGIERMTQLEVTEVNISVHDLHVEGEDEEEEAAPRVE